MIFFFVRLALDSWLLLLFFFVVCCCLYNCKISSFWHILICVYLRRFSLPFFIFSTSLYLSLSLYTCVCVFTVRSFLFYIQSFISYYNHFQIHLPQINNFFFVLFPISMIISLWFLYTKKKKMTRWYPELKNKKLFKNNFFWPIFFKQTNKQTTTLIGVEQSVFILITLWTFSALCSWWKSEFWISFSFFFFFFDITTKESGVSFIFGDVDIFGFSFLIIP